MYNGLRQRLPVFYTYSPFSSPDPKGNSSGQSAGDFQSASNSASKSNSKEWNRNPLLNLAPALRLRQAFVLSTDCLPPGNKNDFEPWTESSSFRALLSYY